MQHAVRTILDCIYEEDFLGFSYMASVPAGRSIKLLMHWRSASTKSE